MNWKYWMLVGTLCFGLVGCEKSDADKGKDLFKSGNFQKAIELYDAYLVDHPKDHQTLYNKGRAYEELKQYDKAIENFRAASKEAPTEVNYWMSIGVCNFKMKKYAQTISNMDAILEMNEQDTRALVLKARAVARTKKLGQASEILSLAIRFDPKCGEAYLHRGLIRANVSDRRTCQDLKKAYSFRVKGAKEAVKKYCD